MSPSDKVQAQRLVWLLAAGVLVPAQGSPQTPPPASSTTQTPSGPGGYWTPERMREAQPIMPQVRETPPRGPEAPPAAPPGTAQGGGSAPAQPPGRTR